MFYLQYLVAIIILSIAISLVAAFSLSLIITHLYKRAVIKGMGFSAKTSNQNGNAETDQIDEHPTIHEPKFVIKNENAEFVLSTSWYKKLNKFLSRNLATYAISNLCFGYAWTLISLRTFMPFSITVFTVLDYLIIYCWPFVFSVSSIWARGRKQKIITYGSYLLLFAITTLFIYFNQGQFKIWQLFLPFLGYNAVPSFLILLLRFSKIRTISLTMFMFCFIISFIFISIIGLIEYNQQLQAAKVVNDTSLLAIIAILIFSLLVTALMILTLKKLYTAKYINEQQILIDVQVLIFSFGYSMWELYRNPSLITAIYCLLPLVIYKIISTLLFIIFKNRHQNKNPKKLLLLRVFALKEASRKLLQKIQVHWQYAGPVLMISGPDLATTTIDFNEMTDFITNDLKQHFCYDNESMKKNLNNTDVEPDNDGSFRITEFFCRDNIWKEVLLKLVNMSNVVLLDLRSFSEIYKGCQYEIQQLVNHINISNVIVLIDDHTKIDFLKTTFINALRNIEKASPNVSDEKPQVQLFSLKRDDSNNFSNLLKLLCQVSENAR